MTDRQLSDTHASVQEAIAEAESAANPGRASRDERADDAAEAAGDVPPQEPPAR